MIDGKSDPPKPTAPFDDTLLRGKSVFNGANLSDQSKINHISLFAPNESLQGDCVYERPLDEEFELNLIHRRRG